ncbi:hypothetical protein B0T18DRAFT_140925 [Schizothecium vesticola]|uniref:Uncharacterized protein n=1 Tax=Schizothecium vesticola TaxID=314040 RepID=A0AA40K4V3_9PEZI|nr:hypothetical protein B0T18DRAFT_140925 [Schizothecium vesticola]
MPHLRHLKFCHLGLYEKVHGQGFGQNIAITTHSTLKTLSISSYPYPATPRPGGLNMPLLNGKTELRALDSTRIDLMTWAPILKELTKLKSLRFRYRPWAEVHDREHRQRSKEDVHYHQTAETTLSKAGVLDEILESLLGRLTSLGFDLTYPADYRWGAFERLRRLRVPAACFLCPSNWELFATESEKTPPMIPASLLSLVILGFAPIKGSHTPGSNSDGWHPGCGCGQEFALVCFLEKVGSKGVQKSRDSEPLDVILVLKDGATTSDVFPLVRKMAPRSSVRLVLENGRTIRSEIGAQATSHRDGQEVSYQTEAWSGGTESATR